MTKGINKIGEIPFQDLIVPVYNDSLNTYEDGYCCWRVRNPDVGYKGHLYVNYETGEVTYPEGARMPIQTSRDVEIIPSFILTGIVELDNDWIERVTKHLEYDFKIRNGKKLTSS